MIKIFWQITESKYHFLRNIEGCNNLSDLDAVFKDRVHIERIVEGIGCLEVFQFFNDSCNSQSINNKYKEILRISRGFSEKK